MKFRRINRLKFSKLGRNLPVIVEGSLQQVANRINKAIQEGIEQSKDIDGQPFEPLSPDTSIPIRARKKQGSKPLLITGNMRTTKIERKPDSFIIKMDAKKGKNKRKVQYGAYHNQGYRNSEDSAFPGTTVPQRKWFGIPKSMQKNGSELKKFMIGLGKLIHMKAR
tara:strand:- start:452 stop:949 length:498 start_codon:yes stop_codon:yes gene_type:complete